MITRHNFMDIIFFAPRASTHPIVLMRCADTSSVKISVGHVRWAEPALKEVEDALLHKDAILLATWRVTLLWEAKQLIPLLSIDERLHEPRGMTKVHVLVNEPMDEQQRPLNALDVRHDGGARVDLRYFCRRATHVALSVVRVVPVPRRHRGSRHCATEDGRRPGEAHGAQVATVAPAVNGDACGVSKAMLDSICDCCNLVINFELA
mmetsp:Transcript_13163/g.26467  ORF Transcript_13163/g.26467 Transcript_13163/m.26467 type:complete len:207 (-) Transcript_13163:125-745(-)